jgi:cell wall-associated NlpC family hydrolase
MRPLSVPPRLVAAALCAALALGAVPAGAAPEGGDAIARFLSERGLASEPGDASLAQQMRERASDWAGDLVLSAMNFLGVPYRRGGETADEGFDCSGFTRHVFEASIGLVLPRRSQEQARAPGLLKVDRDELKPGDLVFFNTVRAAFSHVGIYIGDGKFIHSPRTGARVRVEDMRAAYWSRRYNGARRPAESAEPARGQPVPSALLEGTALPMLQPAAAVPATAPLAY